LALTTTPDTLSKTAKDFKVYYKKSEGKTDTSYTMDHSAGSYVYDTKGQLRLFTRYGSGAALLAKDIAILLQQGTGA
jgi:protein SCO1/2